MLKVKEEYLFSDVEDYLIKNVSVLIVGPQRDERTKIVYEKLYNKIKCIKLEYLYEEKKIQIEPLSSWNITRKCLPFELDKFMLSLEQYGFEYRNILIDISSLQNPTIMALLRALFSNGRCRPAKLFIAYAKPEKYLQHESNTYMFSQRFGSASTIPGYFARVKKNEILIPLLGFEGARLRNIIGDAQYKRIIPIIGCPSDDPKWQFETMRNCMEEIKEQGAEGNIEKCRANSIFEAYYLLEELTNNTALNYVLAPIGTKPHTVAATIFTLKHKTNCRLIYDFAVENYDQSSGVHNISVTHISSFL